MGRFRERPLRRGGLKGRFSERLNARPVTRKERLPPRKTLKVTKKSKELGYSLTRLRVMNIDEKQVSNDDVRVSC